MKKKLPVILFLLCACVVAIGIFGLSRMSGADRKDNTRQSDRGVKGSPVVRTGSALGSSGNADSFLDVRLPSGVPSQIKNYEGFKVSFNKDNRTPNWVAWELLASETSGGEARYNKFWQDEELEGCPTTADYSNSGYDRGHLCPAADQKWSSTAMVDCFSLGNMAPQDHALNTGAWKTLENKERIWAERDSAILIVAGPIYTDSDRDRIGGGGVRVPGAFFKILIAPYLDKPRGIAFVYPNMSAPGNMENYVMTIREVEKLTGMDFFYNLPDEIEDAVESVASFKDWNRR